jgi:hypothetical protein
MVPVRSPFSSSPSHLFALPTDEAHTHPGRRLARGLEPGTRADLGSYPTTRDLELPRSRPPTCVASPGRIPTWVDCAGKRSPARPLAAPGCGPLGSAPSNARSGEILRPGTAREKVNEPELSYLFGRFAQRPLGSHELTRKANNGLFVCT